MTPTTYSSMKNFFCMAMLLLFSLNFTSCSEDSDSDGDGGEFNNSDLVGEWKATKIVATFDDGDVWNITDEDEIQYQLDGLEWVKMTNSTLTMMGRGVSVPYEIRDGYIVISSSSTLMLLGIVSVKENEIVVRYMTPTYTSLITYRRVGGGNADDTASSNKLIGEWKATKIVATFDDGDVWTITDEDEIQFQLDGLEWVKMTNSTLTMMGSGVSCSYEIKNGYLIIYGPDLHMSLGIESVESNKIVIRFTSPTYTSLVTYKRVD